MASFILLPLLAAVTCAGLVPLVRALAWRLGVVDRPGGRRAHQRPIPRLGGVAIFVSFAVALLVAWLATRRLSDAALVNPDGVLAFGLGALVVFALGVLDDLKTLRPRLKLLGQLAAALIVVLYGKCRIQGISIPGGVFELGVLSIPVTVLWIVLITNAVNLLDGLDGLAAGVVAIALLAIVAVTGVGTTAASVVALLIIGSCAGFLIYNSHPASIFMGDSGSLFLGFSLGVLSTYASAKAATGVVTIVPMLIVGLPLADTVWAIGRRYVRGLVPISLRAHLAAFARIFVPDRMHIHHRLIDAGLSQRQAVYFLYTVQTLACVAAVYAAAQFFDQLSPAAASQVPGAGKIPPLIVQ